MLASSATPEELELYLDLLDARDLVDAATSSDDVEVTKPAPDLVEAASAKTGDARRGPRRHPVGLPRRGPGGGRRRSGVLTGGFSEAELRDAGAVAVFPSLVELCATVAARPRSASGV